MFSESINGISLRFETENISFSPTKADSGTLAMLSTVTLSSNDKLLDLGGLSKILGLTR